MSIPAIVFKDVTKRFGRRTALDALSLEVPRGSIFGLVGSNGAGKTTSLAIAAGAIRPSRGEVSILDRGPFSPEEHAGRVGLVPQDTVLPGHLPIQDLLLFYAELQGMTRAAAHRAADAALTRVHLADRKNAPVRTLSHGMRRRVMIAQASLGTPELLLMDEPLSGLDPREVANIRTLLRAKPADQTIVISSHNLHELELICDNVAFIEQGRCVRQDTISAITARSNVLRYILDAPPPSLEALRACVPYADITVGSQPSIITCSYNGGEQSPSALNAVLLPALLKDGIGVRAVLSGNDLEDAYIKESAPA